MTAKVSTALRNHMVTAIAGAVSAGIVSPVLKIWSGSEPTSADDAATGTLLATITGPSAAALAFDVAANGTLAKSASQVWAGTGLASGTAGYFRLQESADSNASSTTAKRLQGACGTAGQQLNMTSTSVANGAPQTVDSGGITEPAQ
jgi:hypothetical protein